MKRDERPEWKQQQQLGRREDVDLIFSVETKSDLDRHFGGMELKWSSSTDKERRNG